MIGIIFFSEYVENERFFIHKERLGMQAPARNAGACIQHTLITIRHSSFS